MKNKLYKNLKQTYIYLILVFNLLISYCNLEPDSKKDTYSREDIGVLFQFVRQNKANTREKRYVLFGDIWTKGESIYNYHLSDAQAWINNEIVPKVYYDDDFRFRQEFFLSTGDTLIFKIHQKKLDTLHDTIVVPLSISSVNIDSQDIELFLNDQIDSLFITWNDVSCDCYLYGFNCFDKFNNSLFGWKWFWLRNELNNNSIYLSESQLFPYQKDTITYIDISITPKHDKDKYEELWQYDYCISSEETFIVSNRKSNISFLAD